MHQHSGSLLPSFKDQNQLDAYFNKVPKEDGPLKNAGRSKMVNTYNAKKVAKNNALYSNNEDTLPYTRVVNTMGAPQSKLIKLNLQLPIFSIKASLIFETAKLLSIHSSETYLMW
jgi:hypothetical protein